MAWKRMRESLSTLQDALLAPTLKQKEAYGRWMHTMSAAAIVGAVTIMFASKPAGAFWYDFMKVIALLTIGSALFCAGAILSKGE